MTKTFDGGSLFYPGSCLYIATDSLRYAVLVFFLMEISSTLEVLPLDTKRFNRKVTFVCVGKWSMPDSLCSPGCTGPPSVEEAGLPSAKVYITTTWLKVTFKHLRPLKKLLYFSCVN